MIYPSIFPLVLQRPLGAYFVCYKKNKYDNISKLKITKSDDQTN